MACSVFGLSGLPFLGGRDWPCTGVETPAIDKPEHAKTVLGRRLSPPLLVSSRSLHPSEVAEEA
jgi:hypothetical protein